MAIRRICRRRDQTGSDGAAAKDRTEWLPPVSSRGVIAAGNQFRRGSSTVVALRVHNTDRHFDLISITYLYILRAWSMQQERHAKRLDFARTAGPGAHGALAGRTRADWSANPRTHAQGWGRDLGGGRVEDRAVTQCQASAQSTQWARTSRIRLSGQRHSQRRTYTDR
jgi:hypothetical protein